MPHWDANVTMHSPPILQSCAGDPLAIHDAIMEAAPKGANVRAISFEAARDVARIRVEGPNAAEFLKALEATDVVELMNAHERAAGATS
jgi:glycine cleavage system aminomethyltransferase T